MSSRALARAQPVARAACCMRVDVDLGDARGRPRRGPRTARAASRSAARRGTRRSRGCRARRRRAARGGRGWSRAASGSRSRAGSAGGACRRLERTRRARPSSLSAVGCRTRWPACGRSRGRCRSACRPPPRSISSRSSSNERPSVLPAPAVFSSSRRQRLGLARACSSSSPTRASASSCGSPDGRAGVEHHAVGSDLVAHAQRMDQRGGRLGAHLAVLRGRVDQVDGVDRDRLDRPVLHQLEELGDVVVLPARRPPLRAATG